jgi:hypothetical protein
MISTRAIKSRTFLLAGIVGSISALLFGLAYLSANALLPPPPEGWRWSLCVGDCGWYKTIADHGYDAMPDPQLKVANYGFFPAFPLAVSLLMHVSGLTFVTAGIVLNGILSLAFCWLGLNYRHELQLRNEAEAVTFLFAFLLSPWSLYNHIPYTEMMFNVSVLGTFVFWRSRNYVAAAVFGIVLTATRASGIILPLVLLVELLYRERRRVIDIILRPDARFRTVAVMPFGLIAFVVFLYLHVGDPLAYVHIQEIGWAQGFRNPAAVLWAGVFVGVNSLYGVVAFVAASVLLFVGILLRRIPVSLASFAWLVPCLSAASMMSGQARYALALFPIYLLVPAVPRATQLLIISILAFCQIILVYYWLQISGMLI